MSRRLREAAGELKFKFAFFDVYGTLATFYPPRERIQMDAAAQFGLRLTNAGVARGYAEADRMLGDQNAVQPVKDMSPSAREDFFTRFEQAVLAGDGHKVDAETARSIWRIVRDQNAGFKPFPDVVENLTKIRALGVKNAVISNLNHTGAELEREFNLPHLIEFIVTSRDAGAEKPSARIFKYALQKADVDARDAIFVGDQIVSDVRGAQNAQIQPVLLDRCNAYPRFAECPRVENMQALYKWLKSARAV